MINLLPNKLVMLRKHCKLSQQDVADELGLSVQQYMAYENGSMMFNIDQFMILSELFHVSMEDMLVNSDDIPLPNLIGDSVEIPFLNQETTDIPFINSVPKKDPVYDTVKIPSYNSDYEEDEGLEKTMATRIVETMEIDREELKSAEARAKETVRKKKRKPKVLNFVLLGAIVALALLILFMVINGFGGKHESDLSLTDTNRLSAAEVFSIYLDDRQHVVTHGQAINTGDFTKVVQVSARKNFALGLKENGTVVCTATIDACNVAKWENIVMVAAGEDHSLGLRDDGTVVCSGNEDACAVAEWEDITSVYAGNELSVGVTTEGNVVATGKNIPVSLLNLSNVKSLALGDTQALVLYVNGTCTSISLDGASAANVQDWNNIDQIAIGKDFAAGLKMDGTMVVSSKDEDFTKEVESWKGVRFIAANEDYLIAINEKGLMKGAGDNRYDQYVNSEEKNTEEKEEEKEVEKTQLAKVTNIVFTPNSRQLTIKWDSVPNADYYEISVNIPGGYKVKSKTNSVTIDLAKLTDGTSYTVSIVAFSNKSEYKESESVSTNYKYVAEKKEAEEFTITIHYKDEKGNTVASDAVVKVKKGETYKIESPNLNGYTPSLNIVSGTASKDETILVTYTAKTCTITIQYKDNNGKTLVSDAVVKVKKGETYKIESPNISGYTPTLNVVSGTATKDETILVTYSPKPHTHTFREEVVQEPNCENDGKLKKTCTECGEVVEETIPATGHKWSEPEIIEEATCEKPGRKRYECENGCNAVKEEEYTIEGC